MSKPALLFNREQLLENHKGAEDLLPSTINEFLKYVPNMFKELQAAHNNEDSEERTMAAHSIKGAIASVCSESLRELAFNIEKESRANQTDNIDKMLSELNTGLDQLQDELKEYYTEIS